MIKDAFEDFKRHKSDGQENNAEAQVLVNGKFETKRWKDIHVGSVVKVENDKFIPADILLLSTSDAKGQCYIETKNLDGETNLKIKQANKEMKEVFKTESDLAKMEG